MEAKILFPKIALFNNRADKNATFKMSKSERRQIRKKKRLQRRKETGKEKGFNPVSDLVSNVQSENKPTSAQGISKDVCSEFISVPSRIGGDCDLPMPPVSIIGILPGVDDGRDPLLEAK